MKRMNHLSLLLCLLLSSSFCVLEVHAFGITLDENPNASDDSPALADVADVVELTEDAVKDSLEAQVVEEIVGGKEDAAAVVEEVEEVEEVSNVEAEKETVTEEVVTTPTPTTATVDTATVDAPTDTPTVDTEAVEEKKKEVPPAPASSTTTTTTTKSTPPPASTPTPASTSTTEDQTKQEEKESVAQTQTPTAPTQSGPFIDLFGDTLLSLTMVDETHAKMDTHYTNEALANKKVIGLYFSADWCGPCRQFTPDLVNFYNKMNARKGQEDTFEIIWISRCRDVKSFGQYFTHMGSWLALPPEEALGPRGQQLSTQFKVQGIPHLVLLDELGSVITYDARQKIPQDKAGIGFPWRNPLATLYITFVPKTLRLMVKSQVEEVKGKIGAVVTNVVQKGKEKGGGLAAILEKLEKI